LVDLKDARKYCKLKEEALDRTLRRTRLEEAMDLSYDRLCDNDKDSLTKDIILKAPL
jgi:hypothetical protein